MTMLFGALSIAFPFCGTFAPLLAPTCVRFFTLRRAIVKSCGNVGLSYIWSRTAGFSRGRKKVGGEILRRTGGLPHTLACTAPQVSGTPRLPAHGPTLFFFSNFDHRNFVWHTTRYPYDMSSFKKRKHDSEEPKKRRSERDEPKKRKLESDETQKLAKASKTTVREPSIEDDHNSEVASNVPDSANESTKTFEELGVIESLCEACDKLGYKKPTPIQEQSIPLAISGRVRKSSAC
jgi:hypothetical protein